MGLCEVGDQGGTLAGGCIGQHHEEEAHHGKAAMLDLAKAHVVPLLKVPQHATTGRKKRRKKGNDSQKEKRGVPPLACSWQ